MKLHGIIHIDVAASELLTRPGLMARLRAAVDARPDSSTGRLRAALAAATIIDALRQALVKVGATDAISLVVDDLTLFQDRERRPDDLGDLFLAFHEHAPAIPADFRSLRLAVERVEAGVHYVLEMQARTEVSKGESPVRVVVSGRMADFEPRPGEDAEAYRARVEPLLQQPVLIELARVLFESFVARVRDAIARALPEARCEIVPPAARPPDPRLPAAPDRVPRPTDPDYDPHEAHYPNPMLGMLGVAFAASVLLPDLAVPAARPAESSAGDGGGDLFDLEW